MVSDTVCHMSRLHAYWQIILFHTQVLPATWQYKSLCTNSTTKSCTGSCKHETKHRERQIMAPVCMKLNRTSQQRIVYVSLIRCVVGMCWYEHVLLRSRHMTSDAILMSLWCRHNKYEEGWISMRKYSVVLISKHGQEQVYQWSVQTSQTPSSMRLLML